MRGKFDLVSLKQVYLHLNKTMLLRSLQKTPFIALRVLYTLRKKDESRIRNRFQFSPSIKIRIPNASDRVISYFPDEVCFYEVDFVSGLCFLIHPFIRELFLLLKLALAQLVPPTHKERLYVVW